MQLLCLFLHVSSQKFCSQNVFASLPGIKLEAITNDGLENMAAPSTLKQLVQLMLIQVFLRTFQISVSGLVIHSFQLERAATAGTQTDSKLD